MRRISTTLLCFYLAGCAGLGHQQFFTQAAPTTYPQTDRVMIFEYSNVDLEEIYEILFSDFLVIGRSGFNGPYEDPQKSVSFAKSLGADVFVSSSQFQETKTSFLNLSTPTTSTTQISGYSGSGSFYGTATTYGTKTTTVPIAVDRYDQYGMYLKNVNGVVPLWDRTIDQYSRSGPSEFDGSWFNENYPLSLFRSGNQVLAFISGDPKERPGWEAGQLKFIFGDKTGVGIYLMGDKTPLPANFATNKFGHLEVKLLTSNESFSFAKAE